MINIIKDQYLNDIECDERPADYRTEKEKRDDMGDYLKDRDFDRTNEWLNKIINKIEVINKMLKGKNENSN